MKKEIYSVWVDGSEVNDYYLSKKDAKELKEVYALKGYKPVIRKEIEQWKKNIRQHIIQ